MKKYPVSETNNKETVDMLRDMYDAALTAADLRVICKSRDFYSDEVSSTPLFESVFLTEKGLKSAFGSLTQAEIALLHVLNFINKAVDVTFFEYFYGDRDSDTGHYQCGFRWFVKVFCSLQKALILGAGPQNWNGGNFGSLKSSTPSYLRLSRYRRYSMPVVVSVTTYSDARSNRS
jgi:hypothetical protein